MLAKCGKSNSQGLFKVAFHVFGLSVSKLETVILRKTSVDNVNNIKMQLRMFDHNFCAYTKVDNQSWGKNKERQNYRAYHISLFCCHDFMSYLYSMFMYLKAETFYVVNLIIYKTAEVKVAQKTISFSFTKKLCST